MHWTFSPGPRRMLTCLNSWCACRPEAFSRRVSVTWRQSGVLGCRKRLDSSQLQRSKHAPAAVTCRAPVPDRTAAARKPKISIEAPSGIGSDDGSGETAPVLGGDRYSPLYNFVAYVSWVSLAGWAAWEAHPHLVDAAASWFHLDYRDSMVTPFQNSFFSVLSLLFAIFSGNTMVFLYDRQRQLVSQFFEEINMVEEVMEEAVYALGDESQTILRQVQKYIDQEIRAPQNFLPPFEDGLALAVIRSEARRYCNAGADVSGILTASLKLAQSQNMRQAAALRALPFVHWALLYILSGTFVLTLILLEPGSFSTEGRRLLFTLLCCIMTFVLMVITDLSDPSDGVYSSASAMEERLSHTQRMLDRHRKLPIVPEPGIGKANVNTNAYLNRHPVGLGVSATDQRGGSDGDSDAFRGISSFRARFSFRNAFRPPKRKQLADLYGQQFPGSGGSNNNGSGPTKS